MPALVGGDGWGRCRGHIAGAKDKVSAAGTPYAAPHGKPECSSGLPLLVQTFYPELHSGIPPGGLRSATFKGSYLLKLEGAKSGAALHRNQSGSRFYCQSLIKQAEVRSRLAT
ncbi:unnamed protein product, partial [Staurois parvus]